MVMVMLLNLLQVIFASNLPERHWGAVVQGMS